MCPNAVGPGSISPRDPEFLCADLQPLAQTYGFPPEDFLSVHTLVKPLGQAR